MQDSDAAAAGPRTLRRGLAVLAALRDQGPDGPQRDRYRPPDRAYNAPPFTVLLAALLDAGLVPPVTGTKKYRAQLAVDPTRARATRRVRQLLPVLRRLADRTGDAVFPGGARRRRLHQPASRDRQLPGADPGDLRRASASRWARDRAAWRCWPRCPTTSRAASSNATPTADEEGGMTPQEMYRLIYNTRARAAIRWWATMRYAARWAWPRAAGFPARAAAGRSVTAIIDRMPAQRQREIAG